MTTDTLSAPAATTVLCEGAAPRFVRVTYVTTGETEIHEYIAPSCRQVWGWSLYDQTGYQCSTVAPAVDEILFLAARPFAPPPDPLPPELPL